MAISRAASLCAFVLALISAEASAETAGEPARAALPSSSEPAGSSAEGEEPSAEELRATIHRHIAALGDGQGLAPSRGCKTNSEGVCVSRKRKRKKRKLRSERPTSESRARAPTSAERELIVAYEAYLAHPDAVDAGDRQAFRYHLARLLAETGDVEVALEEFTARGLSTELGGQNREMEQSFASLRFAIALAIFLVYLVMAVLFESFILPMVIMISVPVAGAGGGS